MAFDKKKYWAEKKDNIGSKRPKPQVEPTGDAEIAFVDGRMVSKNRAYRRHVRVKNKLLKKKGYIEHLHAIRIVRRKNGVRKDKLYFIDETPITARLNPLSSTKA